MSDYVEGYPNEVFAGTEATLSEQPEALCAFMAAMVESSQWLVDNPDEAVALAVERFEAEEEIMREAYEFTAPFYAVDGAVPEEGLQWTLDVMEEYAGLVEPPAIEDLYDPSFLPAS
jgi:ABC-type nitrate/sulfonate/bicarbonate transport system substrate-binding protein